MTSLIKNTPQSTAPRDSALSVFPRRSRAVLFDEHQNLSDVIHPYGKPTTASWLQDSLAELAEALENATDSGVPKPEPETVEAARRVIEKLHEEAPRAYMVYLMPSGSIAIDTRGPKPDGAFITLDGDGTAYCSGEISGKHWYKKYRSIEGLPDNALLEELRKLG